MAHAHAATLPLPLDAKRIVATAGVIALHVGVLMMLMMPARVTQVPLADDAPPPFIPVTIKAPPPPPPPPPPRKIEPPKVEAPMQPFVPPPDIPPPPQTIEVPTITAVTPEPPKQEYVIAPPPPPVVVAPPEPPKPAVRRGISRVSGDDPTYPRDAIRAGVSKGRVVVRLQIDEKGNVTDVRIMSSDPPRVFDKAVTQALKDWKFRAEGEKYTGEVEVNFTLKDE